MAENAKNENVVLKRLLLRKSSNLYMVKNIETIKKELVDLGMDISRKKIQSFLLSMRSNGQMLNNNSRRKIGQVSRSFILLPCYFRVMHSDILYLSNSRKYGTQKRLIVSLIDGLSGFAYLENVKSTSSNHIVAAFRNIFNRSSFIPEGWKRLIVDFGSEYISSSFKHFCFENKIILNYVNHRIARGSKGSGVAEVLNRRVRKVIESLVIEESNLSFSNLLRETERILNIEPLGILNGMSAIDVVRYQDPRYIVLLKSSNRLRRRKWLRKEIENDKKIPMFSIVRIKVFKDKKFGYKESYGIHSKDMYVIIGFEMYNSVCYYKLGYLFSLLPIGSATYSSREIIVLGITYAFACYKQSLIDVKLKKKLSSDLVEYEIKYTKKCFIGPLKLLST